VQIKIRTYEPVELLTCPELHCRYDSIYCIYLTNFFLRSIPSEMCSSQLFFRNVTRIKMKLYSTKTLGSQGVLIGKTLLVKDWIKDKLLNSNYYCMEFFELTQVACRTYYNLCPLKWLKLSLIKCKRHPIRSAYLRVNHYLTTK
jgi:hypothetical protein